MGRQRTKLHTDLAYIAGFLDGDGSVMIQLKNRRDTKTGWRLMFTICFYQATRHEKPLFWIRKQLGIGYISRRNDGITELRINGIDQVRKILEELYPYLKFKKKQIRLSLEILGKLKEKRIRDLPKKERIKIADLIWESRQETYQSGWKKLAKSKKELRRILGSLFP